MNPLSLDSSIALCTVLICDADVVRVVFTFYAFYLIDDTKCSIHPSGFGALELHSHFLAVVASVHL